LFRTY